MTPSNIQIQKTGAMADFYAEIHARFSFGALGCTKYFILLLRR
jgi:hypothetical protein